MMRALAASMAAVLALTIALDAAAAPPEPAASPFPVVPVPEAAPTSHRAAWASFAAGAGLITTSFIVHERANRSYRDYLGSTDPGELDDLFRRTRTLDRLSGGSLIAGEVLVAAGIYLRFLRSPGSPRLAVEIGPDRCVARWRF